MNKIINRVGFSFSVTSIGWLAVLLVVSLSVSVSTGSHKDRKRLIQNVFGTEANYDTWNYPSNLTVQLGLSLISLDAKPYMNSLQTFVLLRQLWYDSRFQWNPAEYGGLHEISILPGKMLKPDIKLLNPVTLQSTESCAQTKLRVSSNGQILWVTPCQFDSICDFGRSNPDHNVSASVNCPMKFGTWAEDGFLQDIQLYKNKPEVDLELFEDGQWWHVRGSSAKRIDKIGKGGFGEVFPASVQFEITLQQEEIRLPEPSPSPALENGGFVPPAVGNTRDVIYCAPGSYLAPDGTCQDVSQF